MWGIKLLTQHNLCCSPHQINAQLLLLAAEASCVEYVARRGSDHLESTAKETAASIYFLSHCMSGTCSLLTASRNSQQCACHGQ